MTSYILRCYCLGSNNINFSKIGKLHYSCNFNNSNDSLNFPHFPPSRYNLVQFILYNYYTFQKYHHLNSIPLINVYNLAKVIRFKPFYFQFIYFNTINNGLITWLHSQLTKLFKDKYTSGVFFFFLFYNLCGRCWER